MGVCVWIFGVYAFYVCSARVVCVRKGNREVYVYKYIWCRENEKERITGCGGLRRKYTHTHTRIPAYKRRDRVVRTCALVILVGSEILLFVGTVFVSSEHCRGRTLRHEVETGSGGGRVFFFPPRKVEDSRPAAAAGGRKTLRERGKRAFQLSLADRPRDEEQPARPPARTPTRLRRSYRCRCRRPY